MNTQEKNAIIKMIYSQHLSISEALIAVRLTVKKNKANGENPASAIEFYNWLQVNGALCQP